jgi:hypothetical protein
MMHAEYAVDVWLGVKESNKPQLRNMGMSRKQRLLTDTQHVHQGIEIGKKALAKEHLFDKNKLLVNPTDKDNVEFVDGEENCLVIEIAPPRVWDQTLPESAKWEIQVDPVWQFRHRHLPENRLSAHELDPRKTLGVNIQRFIVMPTQEGKAYPTKTTFLGIVKLVYQDEKKKNKKKKKKKKKMTRCVSFYMVGKEYGTSKKSYNSPKQQLPMAPSPPPLPQKIKIQVQEFKADDLTTGVTTVWEKKFEDIKIGEGNSNKKKKNGKHSPDEQKVSER